jgi:hypothetical protein
MSEDGEFGLAGKHAAARLAAATRHSQIFAFARYENTPQSFIASTNKILHRSSGETAAPDNVQNG